MTSSLSLSEPLPQGTKRERSATRNDEATLALYRPTWRVRGVPSQFDAEALARALCDHFELQSTDAERESNIAGAVYYSVVVHTLARDLGPNQVATVRFVETPTDLVKLDRSSQLQIEIPQDTARSINLSIDSHFDGITVLFCPPFERHEIDIVAIAGLGSHAFGSFVHKGDRHMWLSDSLPEYIPTARVMIYGYQSRLQNSNSFASLDDHASALQFTLLQLLRSAEKRLVLIGHSLGGLLIKEALVGILEMQPFAPLIDLVAGALFFGVPNKGMNIESLLPMVKDHPDLLLLVKSLGVTSQTLTQKAIEFSRILSRPSFKVFCFYETELSLTAVQDPVTGRYSMNGPRQVMVSSFSATSCVPSHAMSEYSIPIHRTHSNLVKFARYDVEFEKVISALEQILQEKDTDRKHRVRK
ncbi:hypothetical protein GQ53DRAFT_783034 [Thozetella sp. PMI_491]|nr:hypothetical protein GQ53DRAFT_783034 [Thozetella sp. PMI_491]